MNQKTLIFLVAAAIVLSGIYMLAAPGSQPSTETAERKLFAGIDTESISSITLEQGPQTVKLELKDGTWQIPERNGYPADNSKIRALLLKLFDLTVSQKIPTDAKSLEKLAVSDDAVKQGFGHVVLADSSGKMIAGLRLGEARKSKDKSPTGVLGGQFARKDGEQDVYLLGGPLTLAMAVTSWLDVNLINLLPGSVRSILAAKNTDASQQVEFELIRSGTNDSAGQPQFTLVGGVPEGKAIQDPVLTQIRGGLENLRIADVHQVGEESLKDLKFDRSMFYRAMTGAVYRLDTAERDGRFFGKLSVTFDAALAEEIKKEAEAAAAAAQATPAPTPEAAPGATPAPRATPVPAAPLPAVELSNEEEAKKLTAQHASWIYELPAYSARKFRYTKTELVEPPPPPPPPQSPPGMPAGMPQGMPQGVPPGMPGAMPH